MLKIRLQRFGKKHQPIFRVVLTDSKNGPRSGKFKEVLGWRNPEKHTHSLDTERIQYWISKGAQSSGTIHNLLLREGVVKGSKVNVSPKIKKKDSSKSADEAPKEGEVETTEEKKEEETKVEEEKKEEVEVKEDEKEETPKEEKKEDTPQDQSKREPENKGPEKSEDLGAGSKKK